MYTNTGYWPWRGATTINGMKTASSWRVCAGISDIVLTVRYDEESGPGYKIMLFNHQHRMGYFINSNNIY